MINDRYKIVNRLEELADEIDYEFGEERDFIRRVALIVNSGESKKWNISLEREELLARLKELENT